MRKLLSANFARLFHDRFFRIGMVFMAVAAIYIRTVLLPGEEGGYVPCLDDAFLLYTMFIGILLAVFCSLFIGQDYSDGTIRNKVMAGHTRAAIYLSNLLTCLAAALFFCLSFIVSTCGAGIPLMGWFRYPQMTFLLVLCSLAAAAAFTSVFTLISMLKQSRSVAVVICTLGIFIGLFASAYLYSRLQEPEMYAVYQMEIGEETGDVDEMPNPYYVSGAKRDWYQFLTDFLPTSQSLLLASAELVNIKALFVYDGMIIFASTLAGLYFFRRKDLK